MRKIIFLDKDGVLNCEDGYVAGTIKRVKTNELDYEAFEPNSKALLNKLIEATGADIVISATMRSDGIDMMRKIWAHEGMSGRIIDVTPCFSNNHIEAYTFPRGCEIEYWYRKQGLWHINWSLDKQREYMEASNIANYIIIDDDSDMLYEQRNHFIHIKQSPENKSGFNERYYEEALSKLSSDIIKLNFKQ